MDTHAREFMEFHHTLDGVMKSIDRRGIGVIKCQAEPYTDDDENKLWDKVFSIESATNLSYAVYFYVCKVFALRAVDEHSNLTAEQFVQGSDNQADYIEFNGRPCKNNQGLYYSRKIPYKNVRQYGVLSNTRCVVQLLKRYLQCIPPKGPFYRRPAEGSNFINRRLE
uniref:Uncharacterized protein LOC102806389 n=1 Tax=Saccoglossus kowalevskii TaxID=10224 RepID=A0ABM0MX95_SACKO|nr:PREDICTED: uncharacterized protein LOC102806389 [Saccoglossus kowalevskii]